MSHQTLQPNSLLLDPAVAGERLQQITDSLKEGVKNFKCSTQLVKEHAYMMMSFKTAPLQSKVEMHLKHMYESRYLEVVQAFVQKYSQPSSYVYTTICHVEMIDNDKFQFVRRIENIMSS